MYKLYVNIWRQVQNALLEFCFILQNIAIVTLPGGNYLQRTGRLQSHSAFENSFSDKLDGSSAFDPKFRWQQGNISDRSAGLAGSLTAATWMMAVAGGASAMAQDCSAALRHSPVRIHRKIREKERKNSKSEHIQSRNLLIWRGYCLWIMHLHYQLTAQRY